VTKSLWDSFARVREQPTHYYEWNKLLAIVAFKGIGITISRKYPQRDFVAELRALKKNPKGILSQNPEL